MKKQRGKNYISPIEDELDKIRDRMWEEAGKDTDQWVALVKKLAKQFRQRYDLKTCGS